MEYILVERDHDLDDEPYLVYSELDGRRMETRRVEFFRNGICFFYGGERGNTGALAEIPFPKDLREVTGGREESCVARAIPRELFQEIWYQAQERPDGFMGMFF